MTINFTRLGDRLGKLAGGLNEVNTYRNTTLAGRVGDIAGQYTSVNPSLPTGIYDAQTQADAAFSSWLGTLSGLAASVIVAEVGNDRPVGSALVDNLVELRRQMVNSSSTINASPSTAAVATVAATGDVSVKANVLDGTTGGIRDFVIPDVAVCTVTADASTGAVKWREPLQVLGKPLDPSALDKGYPSGSGVNSTLTIRDPATDMGSLLTDGGFNDWSTNTPVEWTLRTGTTAGTNVFVQASDPRDGAAGMCARLVSTGALVRLYQAVDVTANGVYGATFRLYPVNDAGDHPYVSVRLVDSAGTALTDAAGNACKLTSLTYTSLAATSWANPVRGFILAPSIIPTGGVFLEITVHGTTVATAPTTADQFYIDHVWFGSPDALYTGGPDVVAFSGLTASVRGDSYTLTTALSSGVVADSILRFLDRTLGLRTIGVALPSTTSSPTIDDSVVS